MFCGWLTALLVEAVDIAGLATEPGAFELLVLATGSAVTVDFVA